MEKQIQLVDVAYDLLNQKVSVLFDGLYGKESYTGICRRFDRIWIILDIPWGIKYNMVRLKTKHLISVLRYNELTPEGRLY